MARLYPPVTEEVLPAFCLTLNDEGEKDGAIINLSFNLNKAVAANEISGIVMRLRTISTNTYVVTENLNINDNLSLGEGYAFNFNLATGTCSFSITAEYNAEAIEKLKIGQYYKAQFAFVDLNGNIGYWSKIATIKCVAKPKVTIANFNASDINIFSNEFLGEYVQDTSTGDSSEKAYSYRFKIFDDQGNLIDDTGTQLHNSSSDISSFSSTDLFRCYETLQEGLIYYAEYIVTTINGLSVSSPRYQIMVMESIDPEDDITLMVSTVHKNNRAPNIPTGGFPDWEPWEEGLIEIYPDLNGNITNNLDETGRNKSITGNFVILRSSSKDNFTSWQEIRRFRLSHEIPSTKIIYDQTVEQGITYRYAIQQYNRQGFYSRKVYSYKRNERTGEVLIGSDGNPILNDIIADFEDMFLYDGKRQLKIRFNPKVHTFKNDLQEQKIDTIGSKHPFIFRNGNVCYKEFPIQGLISFQMDQANLFITDEDYEQMGLSRFEGNTKNYRNQSKVQLAYSLVSSSQFPKKAADYKTLYRKVRRPIQEEQEWTSHEDLLTDRLMAAEEIPANSNISTIDYYEPILSYTTARKLYIEDGIALYQLNRIPESETGDENRNTTYSKVDLTSENIMTERYFKLLVLDWLTDGKPKLFRSPTEGNYIVRLLNVSMNPENTVGRMIHNFQCTAYEIADFNYETLLSLGLLQVEETIQEEFLWSTQDIENLFESKPDKDGFYSLDLNERKLSSFSCVGFAPGDQIRIIFADSVIPLYITIGTTGTYLYDESKEIVGLAIKPTDDPGDFGRSIQVISKGYINEKFDTIAAINLHTQMGNQLIGPIKDFFKTTRVGIDNGFENSPNVYLTEDYDGSKLKLTELLHLHAKKREIIPIFATRKEEIPTHSAANSNNQVKFMLTPFGNGFIRSKSIAPNLYENDGVTETYESLMRFWDKYGNLTDEERSRAMTVKDLTEFVIKKCNLDIFCLFEVYIPAYNENPSSFNSGEWIPYIQNYGSRSGFGGTAHLWGIYDPYLYEKQANNFEDDEYMGWWKIEEDYKNWCIDNNKPIAEMNNLIQDNSSSWAEYILDCTNTDGKILHSVYYHPNFVFKYPEDRVVDISLQDKVEQTLENIEPPLTLDIGNGTAMELIYRVQYIDYTIERENKLLKNLKSNYLAVKAEALKNIDTYRNQQYLKQAGQALVEKYTELLQEAEDAENYQAIIELLTNNAHAIQQNYVTDYLSREKQLVYNTLNQLYALDTELLDIEDSYATSSLRIYAPNGTLANAKTAYDEHWEELNNTPIKPITTYLHSTVQQAIADIQNTYLNHIELSDMNGYDFAELIQSILNKFNTQIKRLSNEISSLGAKSFVNQYLNQLTEKGQNIFFASTISQNSDIILDFNIHENKLWADVTNYTYKLTSDTTPKTDKIYYIRINTNPVTYQVVTNLNNQFTNDINYYEFVPTDNAKENYNMVWKLLHKTNERELIQSLQNTSITSELWLNYFHLQVSSDGVYSQTIHFPQLQLTDTVEVTNLYQHYPCPGFDDEYDVDTYNLLKDSYIYQPIDIRTLGNNNIPIIKHYDNGLVEYLYTRSAEIQNIITSQNHVEKIENYRLKYGIVYDSEEPPTSFDDWLETKKFVLGEVIVDTDGNIIINPSELEELINAIYLAHPSITIEELWNTLLKQSFIQSLPNATAINALITAETPDDETPVLIDKSIREYLYDYVVWYINNKREYYLLANSCYEYKNLHQNELTQDQLDIIDVTIEQYKIQIDDNYSNENNPTPYDIFTSVMRTWLNDYYDIVIPDTQSAIRELQDVIDSFNNIVNIKNNALYDFIETVNRYNNISENYEISDDIRTILWDEREIYYNVYNEIVDILKIYNKNYATLDDNVIFDAYIDFLESYIKSSNNTVLNMSAKYRQLLNEAQQMANTVVDQTNEPNAQRAKITEAWKIFLENLAAVYQIEVKERFG